MKESNRVGFYRRGRTFVAGEDDLPTGGLGQQQVSLRRLLSARTSLECKPLSTRLDGSYLFFLAVSARDCFAESLGLSKFILVECFELYSCNINHYAVTDFGERFM